MSRGFAGGQARDNAEATVVFALIGLAAILLVALRIPCVSMPLERDEGGYAYMVQRTLAGDVPYRDVWDQKPPGVYLAYLPAIALGGGSRAAIHLTAYLATVLTALFLFLGVRRLKGGIAAAASVVVFVALTIEPTWLATASNTEHFMLLPMVASFWCVLRAEDSRRASWWAAAGALAAAACWVKPVAVTHAAFLALFVLARWALGNPRGPVRNLAQAAGWASAGGAAVTILVTGAVVASGAWPSFVDAVIRYNLEYTGVLTVAERWSLLRAGVSNQAPALWAVVGASAIALFDLRRERRVGALLLLGAVASAALGISVGGHFYGHYFLQMAPALAVSAGIGMARLIELRSEGSTKGLLLAKAGLVAVCVAGPGLGHHREFFFKKTPAEKVRQLYGINPFDVSDEIASHLSRVTAPEDRVLIYGSEPQILLASRRRSSTRFVWFYPLMTGGPQTIPRQRLAWEEIERNRPRVALITNLETSVLEQPGAPQFLQQRVAGMLRAGWVLDGARVFDTQTGRMVFGEAARDVVARRRAGGPGVDMLLFFRVN